MKRRLKKIVNISLFGLPLLVSAQTSLINGVGGIGLATIQTATLSVGVIVNNVVSWVSGLLIAVAALFVIYAAYLYLTAEGDANKVADASKYILWAVIATIVALSSFGIIKLGQAVFGF